MILDFLSLGALPKRILFSNHGDGVVFTPRSKLMQAGPEHIFLSIRVMSAALGGLAI
jgi:hypothetical protein